MRCLRLEGHEGNGGKKTLHNNCHPGWDAGQSHKSSKCFSRQNSDSTPVTRGQILWNFSRKRQFYFPQPPSPLHPPHAEKQTLGAMKVAEFKMTAAVTVRLRANLLALPRSLESRQATFTENEHFSFLLGFPQGKT